MSITRRGFTAGAASLAGLARPALAQSGPILVGWMGAVTGPLVAPSDTQRDGAYALAPGYS